MALIICRGILTIKLVGVAREEKGSGGGASRVRLLDVDNQETVRIGKGFGMPFRIGGGHGEGVCE